MTKAQVSEASNIDGGLVYSHCHPGVGVLPSQPHLCWSLLQGMTSHISRDGPGTLHNHCPSRPPESPSTLLLGMTPLSLSDGPETAHIYCPTHPPLMSSGLVHDTATAGLHAPPLAWTSSFHGWGTSVRQHLQVEVQPLPVIHQLWRKSFYSCEGFTTAPCPAPGVVTPVATPVAPS